MTPSTTCGVCGTVNVLATGRCIACSQPLGALDLTEGLPAPGGPGDPALDAKTAPLEEGAYAAAAARAAADATPAAAPPPPPPSPAPPSPPAAPAQQPPVAPQRPVEPQPATDDIGGSSMRRTVIEPASRRPRQPEPESPVATSDSRDEMQFSPGNAPAAEGPPAAAPAARAKPAKAFFVLRVLLPEGDKRLVEIGDRALKVGSGLDEVGLAGDPRVRPSEATLEVIDGKLWIDVAPGSTGVYRRVEGEEPLHDGDVVLLGDIAALFHASPESAPVSPEVQVLGGAAGTVCGRLTFLRRDGSPGPVHDLPQGKTILGRTDGHLNFPSDSRLSRRHARLFANGERVTIEDLDSRNGTYLRLQGRRRLESGDALRVGSAGLQIRNPG